jgi:dTDP-4-amino-4,6-dideoxygalactose transaminase
MNWRVPLADLLVTEEDIEAVAAVYRGGWLSMGPATEQLEGRFAAFVGARHALAVSNGTAALHLACLAAGLGPGDEVVVPSLTFVATVNAIAYTGAKPVFAEIADIDQPWLSAEAAEAAIGPRTAAVMAVHYGGHPGEVAAIERIANARGLLLLEDAAHAAGSRLAGRHLGTIGVAGAFSFFSNKNLAVGEGGMLVTDDDEIAAKARLLRSHGMTTLTWDRHRGHANAYDVVALGYNYRIDEPRAAFAMARLARLDGENERRRELVQRYREALTDCEGVLLVRAAPKDAISAEHLFTAVLSPPADRDAVRAVLASQGIQTSVHYPPAHGFSLYDAHAPELPVTDAYAASSVTLPLFSHMTFAQLDLVCQQLRRATSHA